MRNAQTRKRRFLPLLFQVITMEEMRAVVADACHGLELTEDEALLVASRFGKYAIDYPSFRRMALACVKVQSSLEADIAPARDALARHTGRRKGIMAGGGIAKGLSLGGTWGGGSAKNTEPIEPSTVLDARFLLKKWGLQLSCCSPGGDRLTEYFWGGGFARKKWKVEKDVTAIYSRFSVRMPVEDKVDVIAACKLQAAFRGHTVRKKKIATLNNILQCGEIFYTMNMFTRIMIHSLTDFEFHLILSRYGRSRSVSRRRTSSLGRGG